MRYEGKTSNNFWCFFLQMFRLLSDRAFWRAFRACTACFILRLFIYAVRVLRVALPARARAPTAGRPLRILRPITLFPRGVLSTNVCGQLSLFITLGPSAKISKGRSTVRCQTTPNEDHIVKWLATSPPIDEGYDHKDAFHAFSLFITAQ